MKNFGGTVVSNNLQAIKRFKVDFRLKCDYKRVHLKYLAWVFNCEESK